MPRIISVATRSRRHPGDVGGAWWLARWLLVLLLAFDHLSAPFHLHGHDGPADHHQLAAAHASFDDGDTHAEGEDHPLAFHAAMAIRVEPSQLGSVPADSRDDGHAVLAALVDHFDAVSESPPTHWRPDRSRPSFLSHRSLPPAGRAPPLHA